MKTKNNESNEVMNDKMCKLNETIGLAGMVLIVAIAGWLVGCGGADPHDHEHGQAHQHAGSEQAHGNHAGETTGAVTPASSQSTPVPYPRDTCIVSGEKLGSMGEPITTVYKGHEIKICCSDCVDQFNENADQFLAELSGSAVESATNPSDHQSHDH